MREVLQIKTAGKASVAVLALGLILFPGSVLAVDDGVTGQITGGWQWLTDVSELFHSVADWFLGLAGIDDSFFDKGEDIGTNSAGSGTGQGSGGGASTNSAGSGTGKD